MNPPLPEFVGTRTPDFGNLLAVLQRKRPDRPTLFEFFLNDRLYRRLTAGAAMDESDPLTPSRRAMHAFAAAGYDHVTLRIPGFAFPRRRHESAASRSMNDTGLIHDRPSFNAYAWPDPDAADLESLRTLGAELPGRMKLIVYSPDGLLENAMAIVGYETLCYMLADEPALAADVFDAIGSRLLRYYERAVSLPGVGAIVGNDDWGFASGTMIAPDDLRRYVFPWHRRIVAAAHAAGRPAILHSCGQLQDVMDEVIDDLRYDAKHSYEDKITPVEQAYQRWGDRIAILGGVDVDYVCRADPAQITARARALLTTTRTGGGYALGTGNSVPEYVPDDRYFAMTVAAFE